MSGKRLLPLAALLVVLIIAAVLLKRQSAPSRLSDEAGFERLAPPTLRPDRISGLDLYRGATPEEGVRLRKHEHVWVVASRYDAPVQADKIASFLATLSALEGELRSESAELLGDFRLESAQALHLAVYLNNSETAVWHLLAGKSRGRHGFVRLADDNHVYSVNLNLPNAAGLYGSKTDQSPQAKPWMDLQIQNIPREQVTAVALHTPARRWRFVRQQLHSTSADTPQTSSKTTPQWALAAPALEYAVKQGPLDGLVTTLRTLRAEDIADPAKMTEYGLNDALYRAILTVHPEGQEAHEVTVWVGHEVPDQAGKRYARVDIEGRVYILPQWTFGRLFPKGKELLDLRILRVQSPEITRLTWQRNEETWTLERLSPVPSTPDPAQETSTWHLAEAPETMLDPSAVRSLLTSITQLTADDWVERSTPGTAPAPPGLTLALTLANGRTEHLTLGAGQPAYYANIQGTPGVFIIPASSYKTLQEQLTTLAASGVSSSATTTSSSQ